MRLLSLTPRPDCPPLCIQAEINSVIVTTIVLEGWSADLDPDLPIREIVEALIRSSERLAALERALNSDSWAYACSA